jgi:hypothetical protein
MTLLYSEILYKMYLNSASLLIVFYSVLFIYSILNFKKSEKVNRIIFIFFIFSFLIELTVLLFSKTNSIGKNIKIYDHIYLLIEMFSVTFFYFKLNIFKKFNSVILIFASILIIVGFYLAITNKGYLEGPKIVPFKNIFFSALAVIVQAKLVRSAKLKSLKNEPLFWFNLGFLFINLFYLILMPLFNYAIDISDDLAFSLGIFKNFTDPIACVLWCIGIYKLNKYGATPVASLWP